MARAESGVRVRLVSSLNRGGPVEQTLVLARALAAADVAVNVTCANRAIAERFERLSIPAEVLPFGRISDVGAARRLWRGSRGFDVVHAQDRRSGLWVRLGPRPRRGGIRVYTVHGLPDEYLPAPVGTGVGIRARLAYQKLDPALSARADAIIVPSLAIARRLVVDLGFPSARISVIPNGVEVPNPAPARGELIGSLTTLEPVKGLDVFLASAAQIAASHPSIGFAVYGDGSEYRRLVDLVRRLGLADRVSMPGIVDKGTALATLGLFVLPSYMENCPMALLEAMAAGVPSVASAVGGVPEVAADTVELIPPGNPAALTRAIERLLRDPESARLRAARARARINSRYTAQINARAMIALYERLLARTDPCES